MYLKRKIDAYLADWHRNPDRKPLIVKGLRQCGKTESITRFARAVYPNVVLINFFERPEFKSIVADGFSVDAIVKNISRVDGGFDFVPKRTVIVFDEVQEFPEIATAFKFFKIDGRFDVIASGSLLGVHYKRIASVSVGYQTSVEMRALDFEEFLWAIGRGEDYVGDLLAAMVESRPLSEVMMSVTGRHFLDYVMVGGLPEAVADFVRTGTFEHTDAIHRALIEGYRGDVGKYAEGLDKTKILAMLNRVVPQLASEHKKFQVSKIAPGARTRDYAGCKEWLTDAGLVNECRALVFPSLPIEGNVDDSKYKLYLADTGLLIAMLEPEARADFRANRNLGVYKGALYENLVGEALVKQGYALRYYKRGDSTLEEDFFVRTTDCLVPIEVKSNNAKSKSLRTLVDSGHYPNIVFGVKFANANIGFANGIRTFPYFCAFLLRRALAAIPVT